MIVDWIAHNALNLPNKTAAIELPSGRRETYGQMHDRVGRIAGWLRDLGVDKRRFNTAYDQDFYKRNGLSGGVYFDRSGWGTDRLVRFDLGDLKSYVPLAPAKLSAREAVAQMPPFSSGQATSGPS